MKKAFQSGGTERLVYVSLVIAYFFSSTRGLSATTTSATEVAKHNFHLSRQIYGGLFQ